MRQISKSRQRAQSKQKTLKAIESHLEQRTYWGRHLARPAQVRAGARKLYDVLTAQGNREQKKEACK